MSYSGSSTVVDTGRKTPPLPPPPSSSPVANEKQIDKAEEINTLVEKSLNSFEDKPVVQDPPKDTRSVGGWLLNGVVSTVTLGFVNPNPAPKKPIEEILIKEGSGKDETQEALDEMVVIEGEQTDSSEHSLKSDSEGHNKVIQISEADKNNLIFDKLGLTEEGQNHQGGTSIDDLTDNEKQVDENASSLKIGPSEEQDIIQEKKSDERDSLVNEDLNSETELYDRELAKQDAEILLAQTEKKVLLKGLEVEKNVASATHLFINDEISTVRKQIQEASGILEQADKEIGNYQHEKMILSSQRRATLEKIEEQRNRILDLRIYDENGTTFKWKAEVQKSKRPEHNQALKKAEDEIERIKTQAIAAYQELENTITTSKNTITELSSKLEQLKLEAYKRSVYLEALDMRINILSDT